MAQFDAWLRELKAAGKLVNDLLPAVRGMYWSEIVEIEGDWTGSLLEGSVRSSPDAAGAAIAEFAVEGPTISGGYTVFIISLAEGSGADSTGALPSDGDASGEEKIPFMLRFTPLDGEQELLCGGLLPVIGYV